MIINGKEIADSILKMLKERPAPKKFMGAVLVGDDTASLHFLKQKERVAKELGIDFRLYTLPKDITTDDLRQEIGRLAGPKNCGGFIVQLPLPEGVNRYYALNAIPKEKDVDLLSEQALGAFYTGRSVVVPPSVATVKEILERQNLNLRELKVILIGAGFLIGKPIGFWLQNRVAELTVFDEHVEYIRKHLKDADVVIAGAGHANLFKAEDLRDGALVIDFGFNQDDGKMVGDFDTSSVVSHKSKIGYTPTPGGTGPILVAKLFQNFFELNT